MKIKDFQTTKARFERRKREDRVVIVLTLILALFFSAIGVVLGWLAVDIFLSIAAPTLKEYSLQLFVVTGISGTFFRIVDGVWGLASKFLEKYNEQ